MKRIKELSQQLGPRQAADKVREEVGGMMTASNAASMPRGQQQVPDARRHLCFITQSRSTFELAMMMMKCKAANGDAFVRCVQAAPEPLCILATDYQLQELEKNCTNSISQFWCTESGPNVRPWKVLCDTKGIFNVSFTTKMQIVHLYTS